MKKLALVLIFTLAASTAFAGWASDNVGIYFDAEGANNCDSAAVGIVHLYAVATGIQTDTIGGFEFKLTSNGGLPPYEPLNVVIPSSGIDLGNRPYEFIVGYGFPIAVSNGTAVLMEFDMFLGDASIPSEIFLSEIYYPSVPNSLSCGAYLDGADLEIIHNLYPSTGDPVGGTSPAVCTINGQCVVDGEDASWGEIKSLFR